MIGEFEYLVLSAASRLGDAAYGVTIRRAVEEATKSSCSAGSLYTTLDLLEQKGLITTAMGDPTPQRGGRPKRMVQVTGKGAREAEAFYKTVLHASRGVAWESEAQT
jgi:DNA-binding PadR family transcriptional regulator